jgi:hypothetical protein
VTPIWLAGTGVLGPGLPDWSVAREVLLGRARPVAAPDPEPLPALLPPNERRRASAPARWALTVGSEALVAAGVDPECTATVFASCSGDGLITHQICETLAAQPPQMSPTRFHNSVHNAPAGYWSIYARSHSPSTTVCGYDGSFAAGLLEAAAQVIVEKQTVLLVAYDLPYPDPIHVLWPVTRPFAAALLLTPSASRNGARALRIELAQGPGDCAWPEPMPRDLANNPAAQALKVLACAARAEGGSADVRYLDGTHLAIEVGA